MCKICNHPKIEEIDAAIWKKHHQDDGATYAQIARRFGVHRRMLNHHYLNCWKACTREDCASGGVLLPRSRFYSSKYEKSGLRSECAECTRKDSLRQASRRPNEADRPPRFGGVMPEVGPSKMTKDRAETIRRDLMEAGYSP